MFIEGLPAREVLLMVTFGLSKVLEQVAADALWVGSRLNW